MVKFQRHIDEDDLARYLTDADFPMLVVDGFLSFIVNRGESANYTYHTLYMSPYNLYDLTDKQQKDFAAIERFLRESFGDEPIYVNYSW